jgi:ankyrin repeat protein
MARNPVLQWRILFAFLLLVLWAGNTGAAGVDDLILAVWGFDTDRAAALIDSGVDVNTADGKGTYPLILACSYKDNDEMIALLLEKGADPNVHGPNGETPLGLAAKYSLNAVKMLVNKGADVNARFDPGFTALRWAQEMEQAEVIKFLKAKGAKE